MSLDWANFNSLVAACLGCLPALPLTSSDALQASYLLFWASGSLSVNGRITNSPP